MTVPETYALLKETKIDELSGTGALLFHKKSGARVFIVKNDDPNRVFMIGFRTPPSDSTGVPHILEHSVLCGSAKFPVKDPFIQMEKTSLKTFLNAMTYPDKTIYPAASCNEKDFRNLMDVYMDAVLHPNIYSDEKIFLQEGWHYELTDEAGPLTINGVVYNEMKGALSSPEDILESNTQRLLFPDTPYAHESGGDPKYIPDLTYEQFLDFHSKWYHPSNSFIYLYGDLDMKERLEWLDTEYLSAFDAITVASAIPAQKAPEAPQELNVPYPVTEGDDTENAAFLSEHWVTGYTADPVRYLALQILEKVLLDMPGAPLKQALNDAGIGEEIYGGSQLESLQSYFSVVAKNADMGRKQEFLDIIDATLRKEAEEGIDKKAVEAALNLLEFKKREADYGGFPQGLVAGIDCMDSWLYDEDPAMHLKYSETLAELRRLAEGSYFEDLLKECFLDNPHRGVLTLEPVPGLAGRQEEELAGKLQKKLDSLSAEERKAMIADTAALKAYQDEPATKEQLATLPKLKLSDIRKEALKINNTVKKAGNIPVIHQEINTHGIEYIRLLFRADLIGEEDISYLTFLKSLMILMSTKNYSYKDLSQEIMLYTGGINIGLPVFGNINDNEEYDPYIEINCRTLSENRQKALALMTEIITTTDFFDRKRLRELVAEMKSRMLYNLVQAGHTTALLRAASYGSAAGIYSEKLMGTEMYRFLNAVSEQIKSDEGADLLAERLASLMNRLFVKDGMVAAFTAPAEHFDDFAAALEEAAQVLKEGGLPAAEDPTRPSKGSWAFTVENKGEAFASVSQVQYTAVYGNFEKAGCQYTGAMKVLKKLLSDEYLWVNIRVKGGAYGCMCNFATGGNGYFVSYRDPEIGKTRDIFKAILDYIAGLDIDEEEMEGYIIGTAGMVDAPMSPSVEGARNFSIYMGRVQQEFLQNERDEILRTDVKALRSLAPAVKAILDQGQWCTVGGEAKINEEKELFRQIEVLS